MTRAKCVFFFLLTSAIPASAWIRQDNVANSAFASAASVTWTHSLSSTTSCPNSLLIAACGNDAGTFSSVTAQSVPMTQQVTNAGGTASLYTLLNSTNSGTLTMTATNSASLNCYCASLSLCNVSSFTFLDATNNTSATSTNPNITITIKSSGTMVIDGMWNEGGTLTTQPTTNRNAYAQLQNSGNSNYLSHWEGPVKSSGVYTMQWSEATSTLWSKVVMSIVPSSGTPTVTTELVTNITANSATGNGQVLRNNGYPITEEGVCISSTNVVPTTADTCVTGSGTPFAVNFSGLQSGTKYYPIAYAKNSQGTEYGLDIIPFVTSTSRQLLVKPGSGNAKFSIGAGSVGIK